MKTQLLKAIIAILFITTQQLKAQTAQLQLIHNSADPSLLLVDVYVNDSLVADDIILRSATTFITFPASINLNVGIALNSSSSVNDTVKNFVISLQPNDTAVAVIGGVLDTAQFAVNPDAVATDLNLFIQHNIRTAANNATHVDYIIIQGSTDLVKSDFVIRDDKNIADDIIYNGVTPYDSVAAISFTLDITPYTNDSIISSYQIDFTGMDGSTAVLLASGFRNPAANQNGPQFQFFAVFANGSVLEYFPISIAKLQAIHNSSDPALDSIDIYASGVLVVDNFHFRTATNLFNVPGDVPLEVAIAPGNSTSINDTLKSFTLNFENGKNYVAVATGVLDTAAFAANPEGADNSFTMVLQDGIRWKAQNATDFNFRFINGVTDAPTVDLKFSGGAVFNDNAPYATLTPYTSLVAANIYNIDVTDSANIINYNSYQAVTNIFSGKSAVLFFSGFLNPANNQNGAPYSLFAAFPQGAVVELATVTNLAEHLFQDGFNLTPNPATDFLNIKWSTLTNRSSIIKMLSMNGREIYKSSFEGSTTHIDLKNIKNGIYFVEVFNNEKIARGKVVVAK